jgi:uncharacterized protein YjaG (DUF416 family)
MATVGKRPPKYDEVEISQRLTILPLAARVLFAAACAERLIPIYHWFCTGARQCDFDLVRAALDFVWSAEGAQQRPDDQLNLWCERLEVLVSSIDEVDSVGAAVAENAVACVAYALRAWRANDPQESIWAARQLYDAADTIVQDGAATHDYVCDLENEEPTRLASLWIYSTLDEISQMRLNMLRITAQADGQALLELLQA